jgi:outer membrane receptor protein involved in Fe transport
MQNIAFVNYLKLRGSIGQVGNQNGLGNFSNRGIYSTGADYVGVPGTFPGAVPNPNLKWETTTQYNVGIEAGVLDERLTFTAEAYLKRTDDLLLDRQLANSSGVGTITINLGKLENRGAELGINTRNLVGAFKWTTNFNVALNRNKVLSLYGNEDDLIQVFAPQRTYGVDGLESVIVPGRPLGSVYGYQTDGIYSRNEDVPAGMTWSGQRFQGGDIRYIDIDGDGTITPSDRTFIGHMEPLHTGGITNNFSFKGFTLDVYMNWSYGNDIYNANRQALTVMEAPGRNNTVEVRNRWRQPGDNASVPRAATGINGRNSLEADLFIEDGSYLRISNITLGYQLPANVVQKMRLSSLRFFATALNPILFTNYSGIDPDVRSFTGEGQYYIDFGAYPRARTFSLGLSLEL